MKEEKNRCNKCGSSQTYLRIKTRIRVCTSCGYEQKLEEEE